MANSSLLETLQRISGGVIDGYGLADYRLGIVTDVKPLKIKISEQITLEAGLGQILLTEQVLQKQLDLTHVHQVLGSTEVANVHDHPVDFDSKKALTTKITITEGLKEHDAVLLLSVSKGQQYIVLSKVRDKSSVLIDKDDNWKWS